jgi:hypothetical protein
VILSQFCFCIAACDIFTQNMKTIFHHLNFLKSDRNSQIALFEIFFTNEIFSFLFISCTRNRHSTVIEDYIERNDVIWCELDHLTFIEIEFKLHFLKFVVRTKKFFLIRSVYAKSTFNSDRELYRKRWRDQMRTWFSSHWKTDLLFSFHRLLSRKTLINFHRLLSRKRFAETIMIRFLKRREIELICLSLMILSNRQLSFDR